MSAIQKYFNRVVLALTVLAGLAGAIAVPVANLDTSSTIGVVGGLATIAITAAKFLDGWQKHEDRVANPYSTETQLGVAAAGVSTDLIRHPDLVDPPLPPDAVL